jgi:hypothetical protein
MSIISDKQTGDHNIIPHPTYVISFRYHIYLLTVPISQGQGVTYKIDADLTCRGAFLSAGELDNNINMTNIPRAINE